MKNNRRKKVTANIDLTEADDKILLLEIRNGNNLAHDQIYCRYFKFLKTEAFYLLRDIDSAENVVQDVFLEIWLKPRTKRNILLKHHLFNEVTRLCRPFRKNPRNRKHKLIIYQDTSSMQVPREPNYAYKKLHKQIEEAIAQLSDTNREAFKLQWYNHKSHKEIASERKISLAAAKKQISRARQELRNFLDLDELYPI